MKWTSLFLAILFLLVSFSFEHSDKIWPLEAHFISFLARITHHQVLSVTAVKMPLDASRLLPQDVALALRAIVDFHPQQILVVGTVDDVSSKPFFILREAIATGEVQGVTVRFLSSQPTSLPPKQDAIYIHLINFEDLLLRREERERGTITPELDTLFSGQMVVLGGSQIEAQATIFTDQIIKKIVITPSWKIEVIMLFVMLALMFWVISFSWIDFLLFFIGFVFCFIGINAWIFQARGAVLPCITPLTMILIFFFGKLLSCTSKVKK